MVGRGTPLPSPGKAATVGSLGLWPGETVPATQLLLGNPGRCPSWARAVGLGGGGGGQRRRCSPAGPPGVSLGAPDPPLPPQCVYGGVLRGTGRQAFGAIVNAIMYYAVGLPLGIVLTFVVRMGILGTWCGGSPGEAWEAVVGGAHRSPVSRRPLAGHAGLRPAGRCRLCHLHGADGLEAGCRGGEWRVPGVGVRGPPAPQHRLRRRLQTPGGAVSAGAPQAAKRNPARHCPLQPCCQRPS